MSKTKKFEEFIKDSNLKNMEVGLDLVSDKTTVITKTNHEKLSESHNPESLKMAAENMGLDLTKNLSERIDLI